jgi:hypothetical protein
MATAGAFDWRKFSQGVRWATAAVLILALVASAYGFPVANSTFNRLSGVCTNDTATYQNLGFFQGVFAFVMW